MVVESIANSLRCRRPWSLFFVAFAVTSMALFLAYWIFAEYASLIMVFLTVFAFLPLLYRIIKTEEEKDLATDDEAALLREHAHALSFLMFMFVGMVAAFALWYVVLPSTMASSVFRVQTQTIVNLNQNVLGNFSKLTILSKIFVNNIKVMIFCILFSFIYGAGAIFILSWNASVIGVALGNFIRTKTTAYASTLGLGTTSGYFFVTSVGVARYFIHGLPEILAYFVAGLAGGIISVAIIKHNYATKRFERVLLDATDLILISIGILFLAALIEVFVTPMLF